MTSWARRRPAFAPDQQIGQATVQKPRAGFPPGAPTLLKSASTDDEPLTRLASYVPYLFRSGGLSTRMVPRSSLTRRSLFSGSAAALAASVWPRPSWAAEHPFALGVASGNPGPDRVV